MKYNNFYLLFDIYKNNFRYIGNKNIQDNDNGLEVVNKDDIITLQKLLWYNKSSYICDDYLRVLNNNYHWNDILFVPFNIIKKLASTEILWDEKGTYLAHKHKHGITHLRSFNIPWDLTTSYYLGSIIKDINQFEYDFTKAFKLWE